MSDKTEAPDALMLSTAQFLIQALELQDTAVEIAAELSVMKRDTNASIYSIQLDTSIGLAGFLVYAYILKHTGADGQTGKELYDSGLHTLQMAANLNTPGPRPVAHADTEDYGFILATAPGTWRALTGGTTEPDVEVQSEDLIAFGDTEQARADAAANLYELLERANFQAKRWLNAMQTASRQMEEDDDSSIIPFTDKEAQLALFLVDEASVGELLKMMNLLIATAQDQVMEGMNGADTEDYDAD